MMETDGRRVRGEKARGKVLSHSTLLASTDGVEALTIGRVASSAGVSKGNIQVLFGDRQALQMETIEAAVKIYKRAVNDRAMLEPTAIARLLAVVDGWFRFVDDRVLPGGCFVSAVTSELRARPGPLRDLVNRHRNSARDGIRRLIVEARKSGEIVSDVDASQAVFLLFAYRGAANVASFVGDDDEFARARKSSRELLRSMAVSGRLPKLKLSTDAIV